MNRKTIAVWFLLALTTAALAATFDYNPPPLGSSEVEKRNDLNLELDGINSTKADLASPTFTGTVSGITKTMVGLGNVDNTSDANKPVSTATQTALDLKETVVNVALKAPIASPTFTGTVSGITKTMVGLGNVDNTTDANKPVSTATQTALDLKANLASPALTGTPTAPTAAAATSTTQLATTAFATTADNLKANLASPTFTGVPAAPTASVGTNTTQLATTAFVIANAASDYPPGHIFGLTISNNGSDANNDINIAVGSARDETNVENLDLAGVLVKRMDAAWVAGTNQGCMNTGSEAPSTWYELILIEDVDTDTVDVMCSTTANRATLPPNYDVGRRLGWVRNDGSGNLLAFTQVDDYFTWTTQVNDVSASLTATAAAVTLSAPPNSVARFRATASGTGDSIGDTYTLVFSEISEGNVTPALATGIASLVGRPGSATENASGHFELRVSSTSTIEHDSALDTGVTGTFDISTYGFVDTRGRLH